MLLGNSQPGPEILHLLSIFDQARIDGGEMDAKEDNEDVDDVWFLFSDKSTELTNYRLG